jgi:Na+-translocating ferredoxin:NAD+ oxidoreductase RnfG subunit
MGNLDSKWTLALGNVTATQYTQNVLSVPTQLSSKGITEIIQIHHVQTSLLFGYAFEVLVDGFTGPIRFRVGITETTFTGIQIVSDTEHTGFGKVILNALKNNLAGVNKNYDALLTMLAQKNGTRTGKSGTYDGVIPALEAIILHSFA